MCVRFYSCCGVSLVKIAVIIAYYSVLVTILAYILSGYYLFDALSYHSLGIYEGITETYASAVYGSVYLAMACLWTGATTGLFFGINSANHCLLVPWLVQQMISILAASCTIIERVVIAQDVMTFVAVPFIAIGIIHFVCIYSYFMELMEAKITAQFPNVVGPYY